MEILFNYWLEIIAVTLLATVLIGLSLWDAERSLSSYISELQSELRTQNKQPAAKDQSETVIQDDIVIRLEKVHHELMLEQANTDKDDHINVVEIQPYLQQKRNR